MTPGTDRVAWPTTVTCGWRSSSSTKPHSSAADQWLSTAPGPHAFTAASIRPSYGGFAWPTAQTPDVELVQLPARTARA